MAMDQAREGAEEIGDWRDSKQLRAIAEKSKFVLIGYRTDYLKDAEADPIIMGAQKIGAPSVEKYLRDQISQDGTSASVTEMLDK